jgi:5-bromo-4-chloroindolyl phosphate hydrolysis protein
MAQKEPKRFYQAEQFYFSHLDSVVELTEKYSFLASQPKKSLEINQSLIETRQTLNELTKVLEEDLYHVVSDDVDHLNFEIDVAKHSIKKQKELKFPEENRWLK